MKHYTLPSFDFMLQQERALETSHQLASKRKETYFSLIEEGVPSRLACKMVTNDPLTFEESVEVENAKQKMTEVMEWWSSLTPIKKRSLRDSFFPRIDYFSKLSPQQIKTIYDGGKK